MTTKRKIDALIWIWWNILLINRHQPFTRAGTLSVNVCTIDKKYYLVAISEAISAQGHLFNNDTGH